MDQIEKEQRAVEDNVLAAIRSGKAKMRPKAYFVLQTILEVTLIVVLLLFLLFLASFVIFVLHQTGGWSAANFGLEGWYLFAQSLPWTVLLLSLALMLILSILMSRYAFIYQRPLLYFLFAVIIVIGIGSFFVAATSFHDDFLNYASSSIPMVGGFYRYEDAPPSGIHRGQVTLTADNGFVMRSLEGVTSTVVFIGEPPAQLLSNLTIGDFVVVYGARSPTGVIETFGVEKITP